MVYSRSIDLTLPVIEVASDPIVGIMLAEQILDQTQSLDQTFFSIEKFVPTHAPIRDLYGVETNNNTSKFKKYFMNFDYPDMSFINNDQLLIEKFL